MIDLELEKHYRGKTVFITGHTGFKGTWLALMLCKLGAKVIGYALPPSTEPNLFELTKIADEIIHLEGDIRDYPKLKKAISTYQPDILFHLAAQAIVLDGYKSPKETFDINAGGTVNVLEALRGSKTQACIIVTTDKCYENKHWPWGYRENDPLGGQDPYSASKSMAELATTAYRSSFFASREKPSLLVASVRAGNIIGGGDFSPFRIIPDCINALLEQRAIEVRNPSSARPWLYVLDALTGYLQLGGALLQGDSSKAESWNFGPHENRAVTVQELVEKAIKIWGNGCWQDCSDGLSGKEMPFLRLNWDKAANFLEWSPRFNWLQALEATITWYREHHQGKEMKALCYQYIDLHSRENKHEIYADGS